MVQEDMPKNPQSLGQGITERLVTFQGITIPFGLIVGSDTKHHHIVARGDVATPRISFDITSIGGKGISEVRKATVIGVDGANDLVYFATPRKPGDQLFQTLSFEDVITGAPVDIYGEGGKISSQVLDGSYQGVRIYNGQFFVGPPAGHYLIKSVARPLLAKLQTAYVASLNAAFVTTNYKTGTFLGIVSGTDLETGGVVMTKALSFEAPMLEVRGRYNDYLNKYPGASLETIEADPIQYAQLREATHIKEKYIGIDTFSDPSTGENIILSIPSFVRNGQLAEQVYFNASEIKFWSPANQNSELVEEFNKMRSMGYCAVVSLEYNDFITGELVIARAGKPDFYSALDMAALRARGYLKMMVKSYNNFLQTQETKEYTVDLDGKVTEFVYGHNLTRNLSDLTYLAQANQTPQFAVLPFGTQINTLDVFKVGGGVISSAAPIPYPGLAKAYPELLKPEKRDGTGALLLYSHF